MKTTCSFLFLCCFLQLNAQYSTGLLPKDLLDENSKAMITIATGTNPMEPNSANFTFLKNLIEKEFKKCGINPASFINYNEWYKGNKLAADMTDQFDAGITHHFMFSIRQLPKTATDVTGYKKIYLHLAPFKGESMNNSALKMGPIVNNAPDITTALADLQKTINSNMEYFEVEGEAFDFTLKPEQRDGFPTDLPKAGILLLKYGEGEMHLADYLNESLEKYLTKDYPFQFKVIDRYDLEKEKSQEFKYLLYPIQEKKELKVIYNGGPDISKGQTANDTETRYYNYYVLRNLFTNEEYLGVKIGYGNLHQAMKEFIKRVKKDFDVK